MILKSILVKSDSGEPHCVSMVFDNKKGIRLHCSCRDGAAGLFCEHKSAVMSGDRTHLFDSKQNSSWEEVKEIFKESNAYEAYNAYLNEIQAIENEQYRMKIKKRKLKENFAQKLRDGLK